MTRATLLEACTLVVVAAGLLATASLGGWLAPASAVALALVLAAPFLRRHLVGLPWSVLTGVLALAGLIVPLLLGGSLVDALATSLLALQGVRRFARVGPGDDRASALVALLMIVLAASLDPAPAVGGAALAWLAGIAPLGVLTFLDRMAARERRAVPSHLAGLAAITVLGAAVLFVGLPRLRAADLGRPDPTLSTVGFADEVALGDVGTLLDDPTPVLRLTVPAGAAPPRYARGLVLDTFDGRRWTSTVPNDPVEAPPPAGALPVEVVQDDRAGGVAFAPGPILAIEGGPPAVRDAAGTWRFTAPPPRFAYTAWVGEPSPDTTPVGRWTALPDELDPRIGALATEIVTGRSSDDALVAADRIRAWLQANATYTHAPRDAADEAPLSTFLFVRRSGHCEYFATAEAVLLRAAGHPARVVNGYAQPESGAVGGYHLFRQGHAHSWVEVRDAEGVWHTVDPTPGGSRPPPAVAWTRWTDALDTWWTDDVLGYDGAAQAALLRDTGGWVQRRITGSEPSGAVPWLGIGLVLAVLIGGLLGSAWALRRLSRRLAGEVSPRPSGRVARVHRKARKLLDRHGLDVPAALPPVHAARWVREHHPELGEALEALAWVHYRVEYGGESDSDCLDEASQALTRVQEALATVARVPREAAHDRDLRA